MLIKVFAADRVQAEEEDSFGSWRVAKGVINTLIRAPAEPTQLECKKLRSVREHMTHVN